jgi:putative acetyltransferase
MPERSQEPVGHVTVTVTGEQSGGKIVAGEVLGPPMPTAPTGGAISVRRAVAQDAAELCALSVDAIRGSAATHYTAGQREAWARRCTVDGHRRLIETTLTLVAGRAGAVAGFASLALHPVDDLVRGEVDRLYVSPDHGGRGVGAALLRAVEEAAQADGIDELGTHASWRAVPVFERFGYEQVEMESVRLDDELLTRARMRKGL